MSASEEFRGPQSAGDGYGCSYVLSVAADSCARVIPVSRNCDCRRLWISLAENESKLSVTVCEESSQGSGCQEQSSFDFFRNAIVDCVDEKCVLIRDPYSHSCILFFDTHENCVEFCRDLEVIRPEPLRLKEFEIERRLLRQSKDKTSGEAFAETVMKIRILPGKAEVIIELDAGLGLVSKAIMSHSIAHLVAITRPSLLDTFRARLGRRVVTVLSDVDDDVLSGIRASWIVSRRVNHFLFDSDILKRFFRVRDTYLRDGGRLLPSELVIKAALIRAPDLRRLKERKPLIWNHTCAGVSFRSLYDRALEEEFSVPEIDSIPEYAIVSNVQGVAYELNSPDLTEDCLKKFYLRFEFQTTTCTDIDGIVFWCVAVIDGQEVRYDHNQYPPLGMIFSERPQICSEANVACMLERALRQLPKDCTVVVDCDFTENHVRSYDISLQYRLPKFSNENLIRSKHSMMLAHPHPYGKTIRREPELEEDIRYSDDLSEVPMDSEEADPRARRQRPWRRTHVERVRRSAPAQTHPF